MNLAAGAFELARVVGERPSLFRMRVGDRFLGRGAGGTHWWELLVSEAQDRCDGHAAAYRPCEAGTVDDVVDDDDDL